MEKSAHDKAYDILDRMLAGIGYEYKIESSEKDGELYFQIESPEAGRLIGRRAQMVQALQFLLNRLMRRLSEDAPRCIVDVENYRERRSEELIQKAREAAEEVKETGSEIRLQPMNAYDRRTIHRLLEDDEGVETESAASKDSRWKSIIISPIESEEESDVDDVDDDYDDYDDDGDESEEDGEQPLTNTL
jgi:spoIIIJ-associated protein